VKYIIASTYHQAQLAARQLGIAETDFQYVSDVKSLHGLHGSSGHSIVLVWPVLTTGYKSHAQWEAVEYARYLSARSEVTIEEVDT
jgi:hypothetical protein